MKVISLVLMLLLAGCTSENVTPTPTASIDDCGVFQKSGTTNFPDIEIECLQGDEVQSLNEIKGPFILAIWASWCMPCRDEMPYLQAFKDTYGSKVQVIGYNILDDTSQAIQASVNWGVNIASVEDPDGVNRGILGVTAPPTTLFVDSDGVIVHRKFGAVTSLEELVVLAELHLKVDL
ncbi:MAG: TlpA family protein disulfide reductase [Candidatus Nanopelagicales bacterium]